MKKKYIYNYDYFPLMIKKYIQEKNKYHNFDGFYILSMLYSGKKYNFAYITTDMKKVCLGFSYLSCDGDYKNLVLNLDNLKKIFLNKSGKLRLYTKLEERVKRIVNKKNITLISNEKFSDERLDIFLLTITYFIINMSHLVLNRNYLSPHTHPDIYVLFDNDYFYHGRTFVKDFGSVLLTNDIIYYALYGQKISPLSTLDCDNYMDPSFPIWREMLINKKSFILIFNNIYRGLSGLINYNIIKSDYSIYNNIIIYNKIFNEEQKKPLLKQIERLTSLLKSASSNSVNDNDLNNSACGKKIEVKKYTDLHLVQEFNYMGPTFYKVLSNDILEYAGYNTGTMLSPIFEYEQFCKYMFEFIYGFLSLNLLGIIHMDPHLNNLTIFRWANNRSNREKWEQYENDEKYVIYHVLDKEYIFHYRAIGSIIDFSRSVLLEDNMIEENLKINRAQQTEEIIDRYRFLFPSFIKKYEEKMRNAFYEKGDEVMCILKAMDPFVLSNSMINSINELINEGKKKKGWKLHTPLNKQLLLAKKINNIAKKILINDMGMYLDNKLKIDKYINPNIQCLNVFDNYLIDPTKDYADHYIVDIVKYEGKIKKGFGDVINYAKENKIYNKDGLKLTKEKNKKINGLLNDYKIY